MKILMVAGEPSGDAHGASLIAELQKITPQLKVYGIGGPLMLQRGLQAIYTLDSLEVHGLLEIVPHLPRHYRILWHLRSTLKEEQPDLALLIDYPGFNLRLAAQVKRQNIPVLWFSSPQVWAWRAKRLRQIKKVVDKMFVLFPFEEEIYRKARIEVDLVGHPSLEDTVSVSQLSEFKKKFIPDETIPSVALAIGSRPSEIRNHLPVVLEALLLNRREGIQANYLMPVSESIELGWVRKLLEQSPVPVTAFHGAFLECIHSVNAAIVASGTATLQSSLALTPFVIIYKLAPLTFWIAKRMSRVPYMGMVNILAQRLIVPELLQNDLTAANLARETLRLLQDHSFTRQMRQEFASIRTQLGKPGAYRRTALHIQEFCHSHSSNIFTKSK